ncbi:hypothetical protein FOZ63_021825, partial [Perkinsus olseni]
MSAVPGLPQVAAAVSRRSIDIRKKLLEPAAEEYAKARSTFSYLAVFNQRYVHAYGVWSKAAEARQRELLELSGVFGHKQTDLVRALDTTPYDRDDKKTFEHRIRSQHYLLLGASEGFGGGCSIMNARARGRQHPRMPEALKGTSSSAKTEASSDRDTPRNQSGRRRRSSRGATGKDSPAQGSVADEQQQQQPQQPQQPQQQEGDEEADKRAVIPDLEIFEYSMVGSSVAFSDTNRRIPDLAEANREYFLQLTQPTDADLKKFLERLVSFPKDFRRMAAGSDRLTTGQMIEIYFRYKNLLGCKTMLSGSLRSQTCKHIARKEIKRTMYYLSKAADKVPHLCPRAPPVGAHGRPSRYYTHEFLRCLEQNSLRYNPHRRRAILNTEDDNSLRGKLEDILATAVASHCLDWADLEAVAQRRIAKRCAANWNRAELDWMRPCATLWCGTVNDDASKSSRGLRPVPPPSRLPTKSSIQLFRAMLTGDRGVLLEGGSQQHQGDICHRLAPVSDAHNWLRKRAFDVKVVQYYSIVRVVTRDGEAFWDGEGVSDTELRASVVPSGQLKGIVDGAPDEAGHVGDIDKAFREFILRYKKKYDTDEQFQVAKNAFAQSMKIVAELRANGDITHEVDVNEHSDLPREVFSQILHCVPDPKPSPSLRASNFTHTDDTPIGAPPASVDWEAAGALAPVRDQSTLLNSCGSCYAIGAAVVMESHFKIQTGIAKVVPFSVQQIVDCSQAYNNQGCNGGTADKAYAYCGVQGIVKAS